MISGRIFACRALQIEDTHPGQVGGTRVTILPPIDSRKRYPHQVCELPLGELPHPTYSLYSLGIVIRQYDCLSGRHTLGRHEVLYSSLCAAVSAVNLDITHVI